MGRQGSTSTRRGRVALAIAATATLIAGIVPAQGSGAPAAPQPRILGGGAADPSANPFAAAILFKNQFLCSGSLIGPRHVITAGHCAQAKRSQLGVVTGRPDLRDLSTGQVSGVVAKFVHPDYDLNGRHDIAVFGLAQASPSAPVLSVATTEEGNAIAAPGRPLTVAGWGATTPFQDKPPGFLKSTLVNAVNKRQCGKIYGRGFVGATMLCAKGAPLRPGSKRSLRTSPCAGDSGGPLIGSLPTGEPRLVGLVSYGPRICGLPFAPVAYAKTFDPAALEFIGGALVTPLP